MPCLSPAACVSEPSFAIPRPDLVGASGRHPSLSFLHSAVPRPRWIAAVLRTLTAIAAVVAIGGAALALPVVEVTEVLMQSQGTDAELIARLYGPDPGVSLLFTSNVDPAASRYDYALASGSTYPGQPLVLAGSGAVNPVSDQWETFSAFSLVLLGAVAVLLVPSRGVWSPRLPRWWRRRKPGWYRGTWNQLLLAIRCWPRCLPS